MGGAVGVIVELSYFVAIVARRRSIALADILYEANVHKNSNKQTNHRIRENQLQDAESSSYIDIYL